MLHEFRQTGSWRVHVSLVIGERWQCPQRRTGVMSHLTIDCSNNNNNNNMKIIIFYILFLTFPPIYFSFLLLFFLFCYININILYYYI